MKKEERLSKIKYVVDNSEYVKINMDNLNNYALTLNNFNDTYWLNGYKLDITEKEYILFMFLVESMNFCFWKEPFIQIEFDGKLHKRSMALFYAMLDRVVKDKSFLDINNLMNITESDLALILNGDKNMPMLNERYHNLKETITIIYNKKDKFYDELFSIRDTDSLLNHIVDTFPNFQDISNYKEETIPFYKRATLLVHDLYNISNTIKTNISNVDCLLGCADYGIPRTLRFYGVLEYNPYLSNMVDSKQLIEAHSNLEVEIRANMLYALELIKDKLEYRGIMVNSITLDNMIWISGRNIDTPHHLTITTFY